MGRWTTARGAVWPLWPRVLYWVRRVASVRQSRLPLPLSGEPPRSGVVRCCGSVAKLIVTDCYLHYIVVLSILYANICGDKVHIIAHSMGGLDARYLLCNNLYGLGALDRVVSLSTISTPHRGSQVADLLVGAEPNLIDPRRFAYEIVRYTLRQFLAIDTGALAIS